MQIVEINKNKIYLSKSKGFLLVKKQENIISKYPFKDVDAILISGFGITYSHNLLATLCQHNIPLILCGKNFMPIGSVLGYSNYHMQLKRLHSQLEIKKPFKKQLWQQIIQHKITKQYRVLRKYNCEFKDMKYLARNVKSGDSGNYEAAAARKYWKRLFGNNFTRDYTKEGINAFLNFGYAILRSCLVRNITATGLNPNLGIHHRNKYNPYCLADDIIEPYRPYVDNLLLSQKITDNHTLNSENKRKLIKLMEQRYEFKGLKTTLENCVKQTVNSLVESYRNKKVMIQFPA